MKWKRIAGALYVTRDSGDNIHLGVSGGPNDTADLVVQRADVEALVRELVDTDGKWSAFVSGACGVCSKRLHYKITVKAGEMPEVMPGNNDGDLAEYRGGHMCAQCAQLVDSMVIAARGALKSRS